MNTTSFAKHASTKVTPQSRPIPGKENQMVQNDSGGYVFKLDKWKMLDRFLVLGTETGAHNVSSEKDTVRACTSLMECVKENPNRVVNTIVNVSDSGRAAKNEYALFALAFVMAHAENTEEKHYARLALPSVARIGTHILHFAEFISRLKGWGTGTRKAFKSWYLSRTPEQLAYQFIKYQQRDGWSHRDILRLAHPVGSEDQNNIFNYITKKAKKDEKGNPVITDTSNLPKILQVFHELPNMGEAGVIDAVTRHNIPREAIPTEMLNSMNMWRALLPSMGLTAMIRNLGKMSSIGLINNNSDNSFVDFIYSSLVDFDKMKKARIHPMTLLFAIKTYGSGKGFRGSLSWTPSKKIMSALEQAFEFSFSYIEASGKNMMLALDVSGSMHSQYINNSNVSCREAAVVMAMITARHEQNYKMYGFSDAFIPLDNKISKDDSFADAMRKMEGIPFSRTDCSLPMVYAASQKFDVDVFTIYTDNETWYGSVHPSQALENYRKVMNKPNAKLVVVGMLGRPFTIANPGDPYSLDLVGFDTDTPQVISAFASM